MSRWFILEEKIDNKETTSVHEKKPFQSQQET